MLFWDVTVADNTFTPAIGEIPLKSRKPPKAKQRGGASLKVSIGRKQLSDSHCSQQASTMTIQVPRSKLRGSLGHSCQQPSHDPLLVDYSVVYGGVPLNSCGGGNVMMLSSHGEMNAHSFQCLDERADQVVPNQGSYKSKYK